MISELLHSRGAVADFAPALVLILALLAAWKRPSAFGEWFGSLERLGSRIAQDKAAAVLTLALLPLLLRLCLWPVIPVPVPGIHDEFSYLLASDTFAHGRVTNPPHPMWIFFETIHVNQLPTYMSKYPPAQGAVLAIGQVLGHPWIGVLISMSEMCVAVLWMLRGWLPQRWAFLGAFCVVAAALRGAVDCYNLFADHPNHQTHQTMAIPRTTGRARAFAHNRILRCSYDGGIHRRSGEESLAVVIRRSGRRVGKPRKSVEGKNTEATGSYSWETSGNRSILDWKYRDG
jgi:hypothetical protein